MKYKKLLAYIAGIFLLIFVCTEEVRFMDLYGSWDKPEQFRRLCIGKEAFRNLEQRYEYGSEKFFRALTTSMLDREFRLAQEDGGAGGMPRLSGAGPTVWRLWMRPVWERYHEWYQVILADIRCFPVKPDTKGEESLSFADSWMGARSYGGKRFHEGTDIMTSNNDRGYFAIISMTDGVVEKLGWLEKGGYRIGIRSSSGAYFYYAHLYSYAEGLKEGDLVLAGQEIGKMGDSGYGKTPGTVGNFDVHLHLGIYLNIAGKETSVNPYWILDYLMGRQW